MRNRTRPIAIRGTAIVAGALALAACDAGDEGNDGGQDAAIDASEDGPTEEAPTENAEDAPSDDGDAEVEVEDPEGSGTGAGTAPSDGDADWSGPPSDQVGVPIGFEPIVVEGDDAAVSLAGMTVYGDGVDLVVGIHWDPDSEAASEGAGGAMEGPMDAFGTDEPPESEQDLPDDLLRVELGYPDGSTASSVDHLLATAAGSDPEEPALNPYTGVGDQSSWDQSLWAWPLPDEGDGSLELVLDWPAQDIDQEQLEIDVSADDVTEAAGQVRELWD